MDSPQPLSLDAATFLRLFEVRAPNIMWLLGAGASCAAGISSAGEMIWDFKRKLFCSEQRIPASAVTDIGNPTIRRRIQSYLNSRSGYPADGSEEEYSWFFETTYPSAKDRRSYIEAMVKTAKPSFAHHTMALLMREKLLPAVWTTNFDKLVEDAAAVAFGSVSPLLVADLAEPEKAARGLSESAWPMLCKLHGDFGSDRLMNTAKELIKQDAEMRRNLISSCERFGLAVAGYSGRDASVMDALEGAIADGRGFPAGLFWFVRRGGEPFQRVRQLIERAKAAKIEAWLVEIESFDELLGDVARYLPQTAGLLDKHPSLERPRRSAARIPARAARTPFIRLAALPVTSAPTSCRLAASTIGGSRELKQAILDSGVDIVAQRCSAGVIAFGRDADIQKALAAYGPVTLDTYAIPTNRLYADSQQIALVLGALCHALSGQTGLHVVQRGSARTLVADPKHHGPGPFNKVAQGSMNALTGTVDGITWREACGLRLDRRLDRLWLLLEPKILLPRSMRESHTAAAIEKAKDFARERRAGRRNNHVASILEGWISLITGGNDSIRLKAFGISDGADADFEISRTTGFSGKMP
jgi:hypothetical protein